MVKKIILKHYLLIPAIATTMSLFGCGGSEDPTPPIALEVSVSPTNNGSVSPERMLVSEGGTATFQIEPDEGYVISNIEGCGQHSLTSDGQYTITNITEDCNLDISFFNTNNLQAPKLSFNQIKIFQFQWPSIDGASGYKLLENSDSISGFTPVSEDIPKNNSTYDHQVALFDRLNAQYIIQTCFMNVICANSPIVSVPSDENLNNSIGLLNAKEGESGDEFGYSISINEDGTRLAIGAPGEDRADLTTNNNSLGSSGAVYIFHHENNLWVEKYLIKPESPIRNGLFGRSVDLSGDGRTLVVGSPAIHTQDTPQTGKFYIFEFSDENWVEQAFPQNDYIASGSPTTSIIDINRGSSVSISRDGRKVAIGAPGNNDSRTGINNRSVTDQTKDNSGVVYIYSKSAEQWTRQAYIKAHDNNNHYQFGHSVSLDNDGNTLAVGSIGANQTTRDDGAILFKGSVYLFSFDNQTKQWEQDDFVVGDNIELGDGFGHSVSLSGNGNVLAVGAYMENNAMNDAEPPRQIASRIPQSGAGAAYIFKRDENNKWPQTQYIKASNTNNVDHFGWSVALNDDGNLLAVGAEHEESISHAFRGEPGNNEARSIGAAYLYREDLNSNWIETSYIKQKDTFGITKNNHNFGRSVDFDSSGETLAVGASASSFLQSQPGAVFIY